MARAEIRFTFQAELGRTFELRFTSKHVQIYDQGGTMVFVKGVPYAAHHLAELAFFQTADVVWIHHPELRLRKLVRLADRNWRTAIAKPREAWDAAVGAGLTPKVPDWMLP